MMVTRSYDRQTLKCPSTVKSAQDFISGHFCISFDSEL
jgi:hypothetical protein